MLILCTSSDGNDIGGCSHEFKRRTGMLVIMGTNRHFTIRKITKYRLLTCILIGLDGLLKMVIRLNIVKKERGNFRTRTLCLRKEIPCFDHPTLNHLFRTKETTIFSSSFHNDYHLTVLLILYPVLYRP